MKIDRVAIIQYRGFSAISMVMVILVSSTILVVGFNQFILSKQKAVVYLKNNYKAINQASSAISWAITLQWPSPTGIWQCQFQHEKKLNACIKKSTLSTGDYAIVRGQSEKVKRYYLANYSNGIVTVEKGHWLDYCPENRNFDCD